MKNPLVSIIIITHNSSGYIKGLLGSLSKISYKPVEIIIWDNDSTDNTRKLISLYKNQRIRLILSKKNLGFAEANNRAFKNAKGKFVLLLNPDTVVKSNFLEKLVERAENDKKIAAVQPLVYLMKNKNVINLTGKVTQFLGFDWIRDYKKREPCEAGEITSFSGSGVLIKREILRKIGFFDGHYFMYQEDTDLSWRMRLYGYKVYFEPGSVIYHDYKYIPKENYLSLKNKFKYYERNRLITVYKNYSTRSLALLLPALIIIEVLMLVFALLKGWFGEKILGYAYLYNNFGHFSKERYLIQQKRIVFILSLKRSQKNSQNLTRKNWKN